jgi:hypothetical protein
MVGPPSSWSLRDQGGCGLRGPSIEFNTLFDVDRRFTFNPTTHQLIEGAGRLAATNIEQLHVRFLERVAANREATCSP